MLDMKSVTTGLELYRMAWVHFCGAWRRAMAQSPLNHASETTALHNSITTTLSVTRRWDRAEVRENSRRMLEVKHCTCAKRAKQLSSNRYLIHLSRPLDWLSLRSPNEIHFSRIEHRRADCRLGHTNILWLGPIGDLRVDKHLQVCRHIFTLMSF